MIIWYIYLELFLLTSVLGLETISYVYSRSNRNVPIIGLEDSSIDNTNKPLKILIHGWLGGSTYFPKNFDIRDEFLRKEDCNVLIFDWSKNTGDYSDSVINSKLVGNSLGETLFYLYDRYDHIHLVGFGLGSHLAGFAGKVILKYTDGKSKIGRITAFDPSLPRFNDTRPCDRLDRNDATVVDVYHCDGYRFGFGDPIGTVDFYPDGGIAPLRGCNDTGQLLTKIMYGEIDDVFCSLTKCRKMYAASIRRNDIIATKCDSWKNYATGLCDENEKTVFGENVPKDTQGTFYLNVTED